VIPLPLYTLCPAPGDCAKLTFEIFRGDDVERTTPVGHIARVWPGCLKVRTGGIGRLDWADGEGKEWE
jgi:hypothetical protein